MWPQDPAGWFWSTATAATFVTEGNREEVSAILRIRRRRPGEGAPALPRSPCSLGGVSDCRHAPDGGHLRQPSGRRYGHLHHSGSRRGVRQGGPIRAERGCPPLVHSRLERSHRCTVTPEQTVQVRC